jgi:hypothetical protein
VRNAGSVHRLGLALVAALVAASTALAAPPKTALLTKVRAEPTRVVFSFRSAPLQIKAGYVPKAKLSEDGSGKHVQVAGSAALVVRFMPASGADLSGRTFKLVSKGPRRIAPARPGAVREVVRSGDFESVLSWAIGLDRKRPYRVVRDGTNVVVTFA